MKKELQLRKIVADGALLSSRDWEDVKTKPLSSITGNPEDTEVVDGIIIKGYETKFADGTNGNGERFMPDCLDKFIQDYYVAKGLNIPLDVQHQDYNPEWICGRIVYVEVDDKGFKYVAYIPRDYFNFDKVKFMLKNQIIQGFSKFGWATKGHWVDDENDEEWGGYFLVEEMTLISMSLVTTPANGIPFEEVGEIANSTRFVNKHKKKDGKVRNGFAAMFNK